MEDPSMKKTWKTFLLAGILSFSLTAPAWAGSWQSDATGCWYQNDDNTYPVSCWQWIDGNCDGIAESYYFNEHGYLLTNTITPDGYMVDANGAWIVDGVVQTQAVAVVSAPAQSQTQNTAVSTQNTEGTSVQDNTGISSVPFDGYTIIVNTSTLKYHWPTCRSVADMKQKNMGYSNNSAALDALGYVPCKNCH